MDMVLTLVGNARQPLTTKLIGAVRAVVDAPGTLVELGPDAAEFTLNLRPADISGTEQRAIGALGGATIDLALTAARNRRKRLLIADMDSTMITVECIDELADFAGVRDAVSGITERAMRGEIDFEGALLERVGLMQGLPEDVLQQAFDARVRLTDGARTLLATMKASGAHAALVSGGFTYFTERVAAQAGFDEHHANTLLFTDGKLTGDVGRPILGRQAKLDQLNRITDMLGIGLDDALAVGDGANDLAMIQASGLGVAFHAKPMTANAAAARVSHGDLTTLLYYQGIPGSEWTTVGEEQDQ
ncbi:MAG: phosphoserine phosphatase SerB [Minwuia sp.]|nr:phosphoserine phosphatase SerB [Minwuia sp.]